MTALRTSLAAAQLLDSLAALRADIDCTVPHGGFGVKGGWKQGVLNAVGRRFVASGLADRLAAIEAKYPKIAGANHVVHLGTLGTDNHFIEVCDGDLRVWMMLHCGSRGVGNRIGTQFIAAAREALRRREGAASVPDRDLAWFEAGEALSHDCRNVPGIHGMGIAASERVLPFLFMQRPNVGIVTRGRAGWRYS
jgi:tRNA-splicing ligase RtcB